MFIGRSCAGLDLRGSAAQGPHKVVKVRLLKNSASDAKIRSSEKLDLPIKNCPSLHISDWLHKKLRFGDVIGLSSCASNESSCLLYCCRSTSSRITR